MFARRGEGIQIINCFIHADSLANFFETERGLDLQGDRDEETGATETTEGGHEEIRIHCSGTSDKCSVRQEQTEGENMGGNHPVADTRSVCRSGNYTRKGLVRYRTEVGHCKTLSTQNGVELVEGDARLDDNETFVLVDLFEREKRPEGKKGKRWAVSSRAWSGR